LRETLSLVRPLAAQRDCTIDDEAVVSLDLYVRADRQRLTQVMLNLLSNAVKYNRPGGTVHVTCELASGALDQHMLCIHVDDTGRGVPSDKLEQLFVPFERLGAEQSDVEGTGLGLALSRRLVEAMGGRIDVQSTPGVGSRFTVVLPLSESPLVRLVTKQDAAIRGGPPPAMRPAKLLYIEDNLANLSLVETLFATRPGLTLIPALQGQLGLDLAWEHEPDLILLDVHLPDMPGDEVLGRLRADARTARTPVIVISADAMPARSDRLLKRGAQAYLTKPLDVDIFLETVDRLLAERVP
jgi:CheY-like chemotaxis protein